MYWRLSASFKARLWNERRSVKELEAGHEGNAEACGVGQAGAGRNADQYRRLCRPRRGGSRAHGSTATTTRRCIGAAEPISADSSPSANSKAKSCVSLLIRYRRVMNWRPSTIAPRTPSRRTSHDAGAHQIGCGPALRPRHCRPRRFSPQRCSRARASRQARIRRPSRIWTRSRSTSIPSRRRTSMRNKTMDSYRRFLDLNAGDAALRAEALRRLGDLNLESSESERIERELVTNEGLRATEAIHLYSALLKTYPKYERNDSVLYQLARAYELNAQPDKALASLDQLVAKLSAQPLHRRSPVPARRIAVLQQGIPEGAERVRGRHQDRLDIRFLQPKSLQAWLVAVQAGRERAQPGFLRRRARFRFDIEVGSIRADRTGDLEPAEPRIGGGYLSGDDASRSPISTVRRRSTTS